MEKPVYFLNERDFQQHPVWSWCDDDECEDVEPVEYQPYLPEDHDALFVYCHLALNDGTKASGVISVRVSDRKVYLINFIDQNKELFDFPLQESLRNDTNIVLLTKFLKKDFKDIFPLKYRTPYKFQDGQRLEGVVIY